MADGIVNTLGQLENGPYVETRLYCVTENTGGIAESGAKYGMEASQFTEFANFDRQKSTARTLSI